MTGYILEKKGQHPLREKKKHIFHFQEKRGTSFHLQGTHFFYATLMLGCKTPKVGPIWGKSKWSAPYFQYILVFLNLNVQ